MLSVALSGMGMSLTRPLLVAVRPRWCPLTPSLMRCSCTSLPRIGYSGVEIRRTPMRTEIIIRATRTREVLGEKGAAHPRAHLGGAEAFWVPGGHCGDVRGARAQPWSLGDGAGGVAQVQAYRWSSGS